MMMRRTGRCRQQGYFLVLAIIFVMVIGIMGVAISQMYATRARISVAQQQGLQAFYIAESGLEIASRLLIGPNLVGGQGQTCDTLTGSALVTNASLLNGTFTATAIGGALFSATTTLSGAITSSSNSLTVASTSGLAPHGRIRIGSEAIDYASISGSTLVGLNRGVANTVATSHASGTAISESICLVNVTAGIPSIAAPVYQRQLEMAVEVIEGAEFWAVGTRKGNSFSIIRWNKPIANTWNDYSYSDTSNRSNLRAVSFSSINYGWAVGDIKGSNLTFINWNGSSWTSAPLSGGCSGQDLKGVKVTSATEAWAVGVRYRPSCANNGAYRYTILKWNGSSWTLLTPSSSPSIPADSTGNQDLNALSMLDTNGNGQANIGFAVGDAGTILQYTGSAWVNSPSSVSNNLLGVSVVSSSEAWAVGASGIILKWNGSSWSTVTSPTSTQLNEVRMRDTNSTGNANHGWAVGNTGEIIYYDGSTWSTQASPTSKNLLGLAEVSTTYAWVIGSSETTLNWDGLNWTEYTTPLPGNPALTAVTAVPGTGAATGKLVGSWQQIFR